MKSAPLVSSMSDEDFAYVSGLVRREIGINLTPAKRMFLVGRLSRRMRQLGCDGPADYCRHLRAAGSSEHAALFEALCTHETRFFREPAQFGVLARSVPRWLSLRRQRALPDCIRVLSAGCATGEEAYSIAMTLCDALADQPPLSARVVGIDVSERALHVARDAIYPLARSSDIPEPVLKRFMLKGTGPCQGQMRVGPSVRALVELRAGNLCRSRLEVDGRFDAIFCRNVLIYFDAETRTRVVRALLSRLTPDGLLIVGPAEAGPTLGAEVRVLGPGILAPADPSTGARA